MAADDRDRGRALRCRGYRPRGPGGRRATDDFHRRGPRRDRLARAGAQPRPHRAAAGGRQRVALRPGHEPGAPARGGACADRRSQPRSRQLAVAVPDRPLLAGRRLRPPGCASRARSRRRGSRGACRDPPGDDRVAIRRVCGDGIVRAAPGLRAHRRIRFRAWRVNLDQSSKGAEAGGARGACAGLAVLTKSSLLRRRAAGAAASTKCSSRSCRADRDRRGDWVRADRRGVALLRDRALRSSVGGIRGRGLHASFHRRRVAAARRPEQRTAAVFSGRAGCRRRAVRACRTDRARDSRWPVRSCR